MTQLRLVPDTKGVAKEDMHTTGLTKDSTKHQWDVTRFCDLCSECDDCMAACPMGAVDKIRTDIGVVASVNHTTCITCYICQAALVCPEDCFDYVPI